jgi:ankyrin repeat protein
MSLKMIREKSVLFATNGSATTIDLRPEQSVVNAKGDIELIASRVDGGIPSVTTALEVLKGLVEDKHAWTAVTVKMGRGKNRLTQKSSREKMSVYQTNRVEATLKSKGTAAQMVILVFLLLIGGVLANAQKIHRPRTAPAFLNRAAAEATRTFGDADSDWVKAEKKNTNESYREFIRKHPNSAYVAEARKWLEDPEHAFLQTCRIGTEEAVQGFLKSHSASPRVGILQHYLVFLKEVSPDKLDSAKKFIQAHADSPFVPIARAYFPILYLRAVQAKVGMQIDIGERAFKGLLGERGNSTPEETRNRIWRRLQKDFESEGVQATLLMPGQNATSGELTHLVHMSFSERKSDPSPVYRPPIPCFSFSDCMSKSLAQATADMVAGTVTDILLGPGYTVDISIRVQRLQDSVPVYDASSSLKIASPESARIGQIVRELASTDTANARLAAAVVLLNDTKRGEEIVALIRAGAQEEVTARLHNPLGQAEYAALSAAVKENQEEVLNLLLKRGASVKARGSSGRTVLFDAISSGYPNTLRLLVSSGADVNAQDESRLTPLILASSSDQLSMVDFLLENKADPNLVTATGSTALLSATAVRNLELVRRLLKAGAEIKGRTEKGDTELLIAASRPKNRIELLQALLEKGADVNAQNKSGESALLSFALMEKDGTDGAARLLISAGADVNAIDNNGVTALMMAAAGKNKALVRLLLNQGANANAKDKSGRSVVFYAELSRDQEIIEMFAKKEER